MNKEISVAALKLLYPIALMAAVAAMAYQNGFQTASKKAAAEKETAEKEAKKATAAAKAEKSKAEKAVTEKTTKTKKTAEVKLKETTEKAPKTPDKVTGEYNGKKVYTGPRGGRYYINKNGNKTYIEN